MFQIYEDGNWVNYSYLLPFSINKKKNEDLDNAVITRLVKDESTLHTLTQTHPLSQPLTKVRINDDGYITTWVVNDCNNERIAPNVYKQTIELIEATEILKGYVLDNITITQPINPDADHHILSLHDVVTKILSITPTKRTYENTLINDILLPNETKQLLFYTKSPEYFFTEMTVFDALLEVALTIDSMPKLIIREDGKFDLYFELLDRKEKIIYNTDLITSEESKKPLGNYAEEVVSNVTNALTGAPVPYPGEGLSVYVDTQNITGAITEDNACLTLPYRIMKVLKFEMYFGNPTIGWEDRSDWIYEYGEWKLLNPLTKGTTRDPFGDTEHNKRQPYTAYYKYNDNIINFGREYMKPNYERSNILSMQFRITYIPIVDFKVRLANNLNPKFSVIYNQTENVVDGKALAIKMRNYIKRMKNGNLLIGTRYKSIDEIPEPGHLFKTKYIITNVSYTKYLNYYDVILELSEEYTRRAEFIRAKQEIRSWEIPADGKVIDRNVNFKERIRFSLGKVLNASEFQEAGEGIKRFNRIFPLLLRRENITHGTFAVMVFKSNGESYPAMMTALTTSFGTSLILNFNALNNTLIGYSKGLTWNDQVKDTWGVTYTDEYGNFETVKIGFITNVGGGESFARNFPLVELDNAEELYNGSFVRTDDLLIKKDARETFHFTYQLDCVGHNDTFICNDLVRTYQDLANFSHWNTGLFFLNKKITDENIEIDINNDVIEWLQFDDITLEENLRIVYTLKDSDLSNVPDSYEAIALGVQLFDNRSENILYKILIIQNNVDYFTKSNIEEGKLLLFTDY